MYKNFIDHIFERIFLYAVLLLTVAGVTYTYFAIGYDTTANAKNIKAAIVNEDVPVEIDGQLAPMGRQLASKLADRTSESADSNEDNIANYDWQLTNLEDAEKGLEDGTYLVAVIIPEDFSESIISVKDAATAKQAKLDIRTTNLNSLGDQAVTEDIVNSAVKSFGNEYVSETFLDQIFDGFKELKAGLIEAADGSEKLVEGTEKLQSGMSQLSAGSVELNSGFNKLQSGGSQLFSGANQLNGGILQLSGGLSQAAKMTSQIPPKSTIDAQIAGINQLAQQIGQYYAVACVPDPSPMQCQIFAQILAQLSGEVPKISGMIDQIYAAKDGLIQLSSGATALNSGAAQLTTGAAQLSDGMNLFAPGLAKYTGGVDEVSANLPELVDGTQKLSDGLKQAVEEIPDYTDEEVANMKMFIKSPVISSYDFNTNNRSAAIYIAIILWFATLLNFIIFNVLPPRIRLSLKNPRLLTLQTLVPAFIMGAAESIIIVAISSYYLNPNLGDFVELLIATLFISATFNMVMQLLAALLSDKQLGQIIAIGIGLISYMTYQFNPVPAFLQNLKGLLPTEFAVNLLGDIFNASSNNLAKSASFEDVLWSAFYLIVYAVVSVVLTRIIITNRRLYKISEI